VISDRAVIEEIRDRQWEVLSEYVVSVRNAVEFQ